MDKSVPSGIRAVFPAARSTTPASFYGDYSSAPPYYHYPPQPPHQNPNPNPIHAATDHHSPYASSAPPFSSSNYFPYPQSYPHFVHNPDTTPLSFNPTPPPPPWLPPPPVYGFHNLDRRTIVLADSTVRSYFALPPDYIDFPPPPQHPRFLSNNSSQNQKEKPQFPKSETLESPAMATSMVLDPKPVSEAPPASIPSFRSDPDSSSDSDDSDLYTRLKALQRQDEFIDIKTEYVKDEQKNLKREMLRSQEEAKRIQPVPRVIDQFLEMVDEKHDIVGSTTVSNYYVKEYEKKKLESFWIAEKFGGELYQFVLAELSFSGFNVEVNESCDLVYMFKREGIGVVVTLVDDEDQRNAMKQHMKFLRIDVNNKNEKVGDSTKMATKMGATIDEDQSELEESESSKKHIGDRVKMKKENSVSNMASTLFLIRSRSSLTSSFRPLLLSCKAQDLSNHGMELVGKHRSGCACCSSLDLPLMQHKSGCFPSLRLCTTSVLWSKFSVDKRSLSSQAVTESSGEEDDVEDGFSELETPPSGDKIQVGNTVDESEDEFVSGSPEISDDEPDLELSETEIDPNKKQPPRRKYFSALFKAIMEFPGLSVQSALDKWVKEGNDLNREHITLAMNNLRRRRMFGRALQVSEWLEAHTHTKVSERDYASRLDLIAKVHGLSKADNYVEKIPQSFKGEVIYRTLLANCVAANNLMKAEEIFNRMKDLEFPVSPFTCNQLLRLYKRLDKKKIADVLLLMEKENVSPTAFTYKLLIAVKGESNDIAGMEQVYERMKSEGIEPDTSVKSFLAKHYVSGGLKEKAEAVLKELNAGRQIHDYNVKLGLDSEVSVGTPVVDFYVKCGEFESARRAFKRIDEPNDVSWSVVLSGFCQSGRFEECLEIFRDLVGKGARLNSHIYTSIFQACSAVADINLGVQVHAGAIKKGFVSFLYGASAMITMYSKCGRLDYAYQAFESIDKPDTVAWTAVICGYAYHGNASEALCLFSRMHNSGVKPYSVTFIAVLTACSHSGLVTEAKQYLDSMFGVYNVEPTIDHYDCMIDVYSLAGLLQEALELIKSMPLEADAMSWKSLIGGCWIHQNLELGKFAAENLLQMDPEDTASYIIMFNLYASLGKWEEAAQFRRMGHMKRLLFVLLWNTVRASSVLFVKLKDELVSKGAVL